MPIKFLEFIPLPSNLGRGLLTATVPIAGIPHRLFNVHLESSVPFMRSEYYREVQLKRLDSLASKHTAVLIGGDFNLVTGDAEERYLPPGLEDVWLRLLPREPGFTWNPRHNRLARQEGGFFSSPGRLDRILFKSPNVQPKQIERLGVSANPPLSDHFGLRIGFEEVGG